MGKSRLFFILTLLIIILVAIGSVCADSNDDMISDGNSDDGDTIADDDLGDDSSDSDDETDDFDDESDDDADDFDDDEDDSDDEFDEEDESDEDIEDDLWELDPDFWANSDFLDGATSKTMSASGSQELANYPNNDGGVDSGISAGNPILLLLLCLLSLIVIPLKNR